MNVGKYLRKNENKDNNLNDFNLIYVVKVMNLKTIFKSHKKILMLATKIFNGK